MCSYRIDFFQDQPSVRLVRNFGLPQVREYIVEGSSKVMGRVMNDTDGFFRNFKTSGLEKLERHGDNDMSLQEVTLVLPSNSGPSVASSVSVACREGRSRPLRRF